MITKNYPTKNYPQVLKPQSGLYNGMSDQRFDFWSNEKTFTRHLCNSVEEALKSFERPLKRKRNPLKNIF